MNLSIKNIAIILIFLFLISSQLISIFFGIAKAALYLVLFLLVVNKVSPQLYDYLSKLFKFDKIKLQNLPNTIINTVRKIFDFIKKLLLISNINLAADKS